MTTMHEAYDAAVLADAAYVDIVVAPGQTLSGGELRNALLADGRLTPTQADYIWRNFDLVASRIVDAAETGFQALVFERHDVPAGTPGQYVLAIRGSSEITDFLVADASLSLFGRAYEQATAMYSFLAQLRAPVPQGYGLPSGVRFDVTAHSLGGHLTQLLASEHPDWVNRALTFNGAGLGNSVLPPSVIALALRMAWQAFQGDPAGVDVTNIVSEPGLEVVPSVLTGPKLGALREIFIEDQSTAIPGSGAMNHLVGFQVDSLSVYRVFEKLVGESNFQDKLDIHARQIGHPCVQAAAERIDRS